MRVMTVSLAVLAAGATWGLVACEVAPRKSADFPQARSTVESVAAQNDVIRYASPDVARARDYLSLAESRGAEHGVDDRVAAHYAYLATQSARIADQRAQEQAAQARIRAAELERERILHEARLADEQRARATELLDGFVKGTGATRTARGLVITLDHALFGKGRAKLNANAGGSLDAIAQFLAAHPERRVQVEAFTDSVGAPSYNLELSQSRADAIAMAFIGRGIDAARVRALGYGEWFATPEDAAARPGPPDRRVEVIVSNDSGVIPVLLPITAGVP